MDIAVLLLSMCFFFAIGMPIAYALALSSLVGALWIDLPVGAVMQQFASGVGKVSMLTIPFFVLAGAIMAEGGSTKNGMVSIETLPTPLANCCMTAPTGKSIQSAPTSADSASA